VERCRVSFIDGRQDHRNIPPVARTSAIQPARRADQGEDTEARTMNHLPRCTIESVVGPKPEKLCPECLSKSFEHCHAIDLPTAAKLRELQIEKTFDKRTILQSEGDLATMVGIVTRGLAAVVKHTEDGKRQITGFLNAGDLFGISPNDEYYASIEAITKLEACLFPRKEFEAIIGGHPQLAPDLLKIVSNELAEAANHSVLLGQLTSKGRIAAFLCEQAERQHLMDDKPMMLTLAMTRSDLGDYLGISMEHVSRALRQLTDEGLIRVVGRRDVEILNLVRLQVTGRH
jgi:CRP/FNR family transcriptional regulator